MSNPRQSRPANRRRAEASTRQRADTPARTDIHAPARTHASQQSRTRTTQQPHGHARQQSRSNASSVHTRAASARPSIREAQTHSHIPWIPITAIAVAAAACIAFFTLQGSPEQTGTPSETEAITIPVAQMGSVAPAEADSVVMTLYGAKDTYVLKGEEYLEAGCRAIDPDAPQAANLEVDVQGTVDTRTPGDYTIEYTATTEQGAKATAERTVHVVDAFEQRAASIPVFMYHYVYDASAPPAEGVDNNWLTTDKLEAHLTYLHDNHYYFPSYQEIRAFAEGTHTLPAKSAVLTFDDGQDGVLTLGRALFERYEVPATSFIIADNPGIPDLIRANASPYLQYQSHTNMHRAGSNVGHGGLIHALSHDEILADNEACKQLIGACDAVAYPFGDYNDTAQTALAEGGVQCAFTTENRRVRPGDSPWALPRVRIGADMGGAAFQALAEPDAA